MNEMLWNGFKRIDFEFEGREAIVVFPEVPEENKKAVLENLVSDIIRKDYHFDTGCTGVKFVLPVSLLILLSLQKCL